MAILKYLTIALLLSACTPSYYYGSFGPGKMQAHDWQCLEGVLGVSRLGVTYEINDDQQLDLEVEHESMIDCGDPFNNREESDKDTVGVYYKFIFGGKQP